jgi:hypothetical protein
MRAAQPGPRVSGGVCHDASVVGHGGRIGMAAALLLAIGAVARADATGLLGIGSTPGAVLASVGSTPTSGPLPPGFVGLSLEYRAVHLYTGRDPSVNPVFVQLIRNLAPGQTPVLRIGGNSTDATWWPMPGVIAPAGVSYGLTRGWMRTTRALARTLGAQLILGVNLAGGRPALAATEARAMLAEIGPENIQALEIGNEADLFGRLPWYRDIHGGAMYSRKRSYDVPTFIREFSDFRAATAARLPGGALPAFAGPAFANHGWMAGLDQFLAAEPGLGLVTFHRYPLRGCSVAPDAPSYASIPNLLSDYSTTDLAQGVAGYVAMAHARGLQFRLDEMNSVACSGRRGVSDTFASALWALDTLFEMTRVGVDGVNIHTWPNAGYELFSFERRSKRFQAFVRPEYYGLLMFVRAAPPGSRLLPVSGGTSQLKLWATIGVDGRTRIVMINKDLSASHVVLIRPPGGTGRAELEQLLAPGPEATSDVSIGGQSYGAQTTSGDLPGEARSASVSPFAGAYSVTLPPASAAILTR